LLRGFVGGGAHEGWQGRRYIACGIHGQNIWIDPRAELVIARFRSRPVAANPFTDPIVPDLCCRD
jgi:CubicO group peptidase (beta-lactamase class C family)